jgi:hypothetical protein
MTELETLRSALREDAERRYGKRRRARALLPAAALAVAIAAALLIVADTREPDPPREVVATPTLAPPPPGPFEIAGASVVKDFDPKALELLDDAHDVVRAWDVPAFGGHVFMTRKGTLWCLSAPDPSAAQPEVERGVTCEPARRYGLTIGVSDAAGVYLVYAAVVAPDAAKRPLLKLPDGTRKSLQPAPGGLIVLVAPPGGSSVTLYDKDGKGRTDRF